MSVIKIDQCKNCGADIFEERNCCGDCIRIIYTCGCHNQENKGNIKQ